MEGGVKPAVPPILPSTPYSITNMSDSNVAETGHPRGLYTLFFSEMWERFCYYGMRTLLTLYLVKSLMKGDNEASLMYGAYTALIYAAPVFCQRAQGLYCPNDAVHRYA